MDSQDDSFKIGPARPFFHSRFSPDFSRRGRSPAYTQGWVEERSEFWEESRESLLSIVSGGIRAPLLIEVLVVMLLN